MQYTLNLECPVKWTATQEKSISNELPSTEISAASSFARVSHVYHQVLWLPESMMPIDRLIPAVKSAVTVGNSADEMTEPYCPELLETIKPCLLTPRQVTEKYRERIATLVEQEDPSETSPNDELMWYVMRYDKGLPEDSDTPEQSRVRYEAWKKAWLSRMEQREVMIQLLLHFLLLTLPNLPKDEASPDVPEVTVSGLSPRKRKRVPPTTQDDLSSAVVEQRLELLMDRLAMWQLIGSIDPSAGGDQSGRLAHRLTSLHKDKQKAADDRDWMQIFCEDIVEPTFRSNLPAQCSLLRSKVFQTSPFDDDSDALDLQDTPPVSPRLNPKRVKKSGSRAEDGDAGKRDLSRTKSLSVTLEEERVRARSRSLSIGPNNMQKRALAREVSMSTAFKATEKKAQPAPGRRAALQKTKSIAEATTSRAKAKDRLGTTLVAATPVKPKPKGGRSFSSSFPEERDVLPFIIDGGDDDTRLAVEGGDDDDDWMPQSSPDVLLLADEDRSTSPGPDESLDDMRLGKGKSRMLVEGTPTRSRRK